jgi:hypothetical protein
MPEGSAYQSLPSTSLDAQPGTCTRCGHVAGAQAEVCPRCGGALASPAPAAPAAPEARSYVEQTIGCTPAELETIARREAVDGWQLVDTTVDEAQPDRILANFRRPVSTQEAARSERKRAASAPVSAPVAGTSSARDVRSARKQQRADDRARRRQARPSKARPAGESRPAAPARKPASASESAQAEGEYRHEVYLAVLVASVAMAVSWIGWPGIFLLFAVPSAAKRIARLSNSQLLVLGALALGLVSGMNEVGFFVALWALPGVIKSTIGDER